MCSIVISITIDQLYLNIFLEIYKIIILTELNISRCLNSKSVPIVPLEAADGSRRKTCDITDIWSLHTYGPGAYKDTFPIHWEK